MSTSAPARAARPGERRRTVPVARLLSWLVAIACIVVAAIGLQVSEPETDLENLTGPPGQPIAYDDGTVTVGTARVGERIEEFGQVHATPGMFVVVPVTLAAEGSTTLRLTAFRLRSGDRTYRPYGLESVKVDPGFAQTEDVTFEVDPANIDGLVLETLNAEILFSYHQQVQVPLGITAGNAQAWREAAAGQTVLVARSDLRSIR